MFALKHPHDSFFKQLMSNPQNVRDFIKAFLPEEIVRNLDLENLKIIDKEKIDKKYKRYYLDISECRGCTVVHPLPEHKSYLDQFT